MCGIWGISYLGENITRRTIAQTIEKLMILSDVRGKEAAGIAVMQNECLCVLKKTKSSLQLRKDPDFINFINKNIIDSDAKNIWITGHSRLVTNGSKYNQNNNQPVIKHNMALVHNGIIVNEDEIWNLIPNAVKEYEVDSEAILETYAYLYENTQNMEVTSEETYKRLEGMSSTILMSQRGHIMTAASNNGSLYECTSKSGLLTIFASEKLILQKLISSIKKLTQIIDVNSIRQLAPGTHKIITDGYKGAFADITVTSEEKTICKNIEQIKTNFSKYDIDFEKISELKRCVKCVLPETMPFIEFDEKGVCNYCRSYKKAEYKGLEELHKKNEEIRSKGKKTMVSFSGGRDSSYGLHYFVTEMGLKPIAYCYDWGMVTDLARRNQSRLCEKLGIEFILVSADIKKKRKNIKMNVEAWLKRPSLGMVPLFMAGDKHYYYYANKLCKDYELDTILLATNPFEKTYFKSGYCGVKPDILKRVYNKLDLERLPLSDVFKMSSYYIGQFAKNPRYINSSVWDTFTAAASFYVIPHNYFRLFDYMPWNEKIVDETLFEQYGWERANDTQSTWRIGDGTAPFYNYIYCTVAGLTENDTLRSNQIREGMISREQALELVLRDNLPRFDSIKWYFDAISVNMEDALNVISKIPKLYERSANA